MQVRAPYVAGKFYPRNKFDLTKLIKEIKRTERRKINYKIPLSWIIGGIVPHAGYEFSGFEAIHFYEILRKSKKRYDTIVIVFPNHTGYGSDIALDSNDFWETPIGLTELDAEFQEEMGLEISPEAHKYEHSGEVILPMLQYVLSFPFKIVPVAIREQNLVNSRKIAASIYEAEMKLDRKVLLLASTDFSHFVSPKEGIEQDDYAIEQIMDFNSEDLENVVRDRKISMCGSGSVMTLLEYSLIKSAAPKIELLTRGNSSKRYPSMEVVDYASFLVYE